MNVQTGNWSKREDVLLTGDYARLLPALKPMQVDQFVLEYATSRAGDIEVVGRELSDRELGLGVVNPRTDEVKPVAFIVAKAEKALEYYCLDQLFLNTDCGFGCFASHSVNVDEVAFRKLWAIAEAARILRRRHG